MSVCFLEIKSSLELSNFILPLIAFLFGDLIATSERSLFVPFLSDHLTCRLDCNTLDAILVLQKHHHICSDNSWHICAASEARFSDGTIEKAERSWIWGAHPAHKFSTSGLNRTSSSGRQISSKQIRKKDQRDGLGRCPSPVH